MDMFKTIYDLGIIPVVAIDDADKAVPLAKALREGGLPAAEITFRTAAAEEAIRRISAECPDVLVGAGTVLTKEQCDRAIAAGAKFVVTPGFNPEMIAYIKSTGIPMMPGAATPGEMEQAMSMGLTNIKFFPAEANGGVAIPLDKPEQFEQAIERFCDMEQAEYDEVCENAKKYIDSKLKIDEIIKQYIDCFNEI